MRKMGKSGQLLWIKLFICFLNSLFWISGIVLMCVGGSVQLNFYDVSVVVKEISSGAPVVLFASGILIFFLSLFGCMAILLESKIMIQLFTVLMFIMFFMEVGVGISAYVYRGLVHNTVVNLFLKTMQKYSTEPEIKSSMDHLQEMLDCCGATDFTDWFNTSLVNVVPDSCCVEMKHNCGFDVEVSGEKNINMQGCVVKLQNWIQDHHLLIGGVGVGLGITHIVGMTVCCILLHQLKEEYEGMR
ncbi:CD63 antigen-like [Erpetoichthys calabaricus]|uniref:CD63 antigen-like n=1 Tax=Erpetoichthys calabaricus TaxID=27687 RepID=UPI002234E666|nr:CD63 antigen-like [Erpetoichthys calabaricus]